MNSDRETAATYRDRLLSEIRERPVSIGAFVGLVIGQVLAIVAMEYAEGLTGTETTCVATSEMRAGAQRIACEPMWTMRLQMYVALGTMLVGAGYGYLSTRTEFDPHSCWQYAKRYFRTEFFWYYLAPWMVVVLLVTLLDALGLITIAV